MLYHENYFWLGFPFFRDHMLVAEGMRTRYMDTTSLDAIFSCKKTAADTLGSQRESPPLSIALSPTQHMSSFLLGSRQIGCFCYHQYLCTQAGKNITFGHRTKSDQVTHVTGQALLKRTIWPIKIEWLIGHPRQAAGS